MCTHELWTYPECGCTVDHHIKCLDLENESHQSPAHPPAASQGCEAEPSLSTTSVANPHVFIHPPTYAPRHESFRNQARSSPTNLPLSPSPSPPSTSDSDSEDNSNPEGYYHAHLRINHPICIRPTKPRVNSTKTQPQRAHSNEPKPRSCSTPQTTHKTFLEPICDDCLLDEIGAKRYSGVLPCVHGANDAHHAAQSQEEEVEKEQRGRNGHARSGSGLIWSSDVKIEITSSASSSTAQTQSHPDYRTGSSTSLVPHTPIIHMVLAHDGTTSISPSSTNTDSSAADFSPTANPNPEALSNLPPDISRFEPTQKSSIDLARRRPWLLKGLEAYMRKNSDSTVNEEEVQHEKEILESTVEVEVLDEFGLIDALESELPLSRRLASFSANASIPDHGGDDKTETAADLQASSPAARFQFPSARFPYAPPVSPSSFTTDSIPAAAHPFEGSVRARQPSTVSVTVSTLDGTDADDEASLHTSSPAPMLTPLPDPAAASLAPPPVLIPGLDSGLDPVPDLDPDLPKTILSSNVTTRHPNTRIKALRRRGLDISRSSFALNALRLSSAWGSRERECLRGFRADILGREREVEGIEGAGRKARGDDVSHTNGRFQDGVRSRGHDGVRAGSRLRVREEPPKATLNVEDKGDNLENQSMIGPEDQRHRHNEAKVEGPWSEDILKSLDEAHVTNDLVNTDTADPPSIKFHRTQASMNKGSGSRARGRSRGRSPAKTLLTRFTRAQTDGKTWAKSVLGDLKRSLSRDSRGRKLKAFNANRIDLDSASAVRGSGVENSENTTATATCTLRAVIDDAEKGNQGHCTDTNACDRRGSGQTTTSQATSTSIGSGSVTEGNLYIHPGAAHSEISAQAASTESWEAHLSHDLAIPRTTKKHIFRNAALSKSEARLTSSTANYYAGKNIKGGQYDTRRYSSAGTLGKNWFARSSPVLPSGEERYEYGSGELKKRVLSTSTGPSVPGIASEICSGTWVATDPGSVAGSGDWKGERLASIVGPEDFEEEEGLIGSPWVVPVDGAGDGTEVEGPLNTAPPTPWSALEYAENRVSTQIDDTNGQEQHRRLRSASNPGHWIASMNNTNPEVQQSVNTSPERPRNPTPSSAPSFRFKPRLPPNQATLTQHALSTPLRVSTPARAILPERTSSLSPLPMIMPTRVGISPGFGFRFIADVEEPEGSASGSPLIGTVRKDGAREEMAVYGIERDGGPPKTKHSPMSNFPCVWKKYLCTGGCGGIAREEVESCICAKALGAGEIDAQGKVESGRAQCRSTAPVVRYVEGVCEVRTEDDNSHADHVGGIPSGRCRLCEKKS